MKELLSKIDINMAIVILGGLSIVITIARKKYPKIDTYLSKAAPVIEEIDDLIEVAINEFPNNVALKNTDKVLDKVISELKQAGYNVDLATKKKIKNRAKAKISRELGK